ncbi:MAG: TetR/AcrR family transcriptional regulator, partial [Planctomycetota bacterium]
MRKPPETTRESLVEAAIRVLATNPAANLSEIAAEAGVKRVTLHRLIGTREELLKEIAIRSLAEMDEACERAAKNARTSLEALRACVEALVPMGDRWHFLWTQSEVWEELSVAKEIARQNAELAQLIDNAKAEGAIAADIPTAWIVAAIEAVVYAALRIARAGDIAVNDAGKLAVRTLLFGIGT